MSDWCELKWSDGSWQLEKVWPGSGEPSTNGGWKDGRKGHIVDGQRVTVGEGGEIWMDSSQPIEQASNPSTTY